MTGLRVSIALFVTLIAAQTNAGYDIAQFDPAPLFQEDQRASVNSEPLIMRLFENQLFVLGSTDTANGQISVLDVDTLIIERARKLPIIPSDMVVDRHGQVFVLGRNAAGQGRVLAMNSELQSLDKFDTETAFTYPVLSLPGVDTLIIGSMNEPMLILNTEDTTKLRTSSTFNPPAFSTGVGLTWTSADLKTLFVNHTTGVSLIAYDIASTRPLGSIGYSIKGGEVEPYQTYGITGEYPCHSTEGASFLVWDPRRESLTLAEFDPIFRSLDIQTNAQTRLGAKGPSQQDLIPGMETFRPSGLLASNCDQSAILLGSTRSNRIIQYAVNKDYRSIEATGIIDASFKPVSVVMDPKGRFAFFASAQKQQVVRFKPQTNNGDDEVPLLGDPVIRDLQRLLTDNGYPVGSIDGFMGPVTQKAFELYQENTGIELDLDNLSSELEKSRAKLR